MTTQLKNRKSSTRSITLRTEPNPETDRELEWLFTSAETEIGTSSNWEPFVDAALSGARGIEGDGLDEADRRADAMHRAGTIVGWLEAMPPPLMAVLVAAYEPRSWPAHYALKLGRLAGVVATLDSVRRDHSAACASGRTSEGNVVDWLDEGIIRGHDERAQAAWEEALPRYAQALAAYRKVRGTRPCLVQEGEVES